MEILFLLAGIIAICAFLITAEGIVWLWEQIEAAEKRRERKERCRYHES